MSKTLATKCQANYYGTPCNNTTTHPAGMCHKHTGLIGPSQFTLPKKSERFPKPVYAPADKELIDENTGLIPPKRLLKESLGMIVEGLATVDPIKTTAGVLSTGPIGSALFDKWRVEEGIDIGTNRYFRVFSVPLPSVTKEAEGSFLPYEVNWNYKKEFKTSSRLSQSLREARRVFPTHFVQSTLEDQCNSIYARVIQLTSEGKHDAAALLMDHMKQFAALAANTDPATAADNTADYYESLPKADKPVLKQPLQNAINTLPILTALEPLLKKLPLTTMPEVNEEQRDALQEIIGRYRETARTLRPNPAIEMPETIRVIQSRADGTLKERTIQTRNAP